VTIIRTLIVDVEPFSRERLCGLLADQPDVEVVGKCDDGCRAVVAIEELNPDLVFLDVEIPRLDGFDILEDVTLDRTPAVVFVTANDRYAARAFEVQAVDYILKPFGRERLLTALGRAREKITSKNAVDGAESRAALRQDSPSPEHRYPKRIIVKQHNRLIFLPTVDIDWVESSGNYVRFHIGAESHLLRQRMRVVESRLDPDRFIRIHRGTIVNLERIREMRPKSWGDYEVVLQDNQSLTMSARYREKLHELRVRMLTS
jgi:two-component system, LytTR family, response regulator